MINLSYFSKYGDYSVDIVNCIMCFMKGANMVAINNNVNLEALYANKNVSATQMAKIKEATQDGVISQAELAELKKMGVDTAPLTANFEIENAGEAQATATGGVSAAQIATMIAELQEKYGAEEGGSYSTSNPQVKALKQAMDDGVIAQLGAAGYTKEQIIDVIKSVFPSAGIAPTANGGYSLPNGSGEAKDIYNEFKTQLLAAVGTSPEMQALQTEIAALNLQITSNNTQISSLKASIEKLQTEVETAIEEAIQESEEIAEEQKADAARIVNEQLNAYTSANGEMTYDEFERNVTSRLDALSADGNSKMSQVVRNIMNAESKMGTLKNYVTQMGALIQENKTLSDQVKTKTADMSKLKEEMVQAEDPDCQRCDPIGFTHGNARYDFFVDKDGDGQLSNEKEFLGAENGWAEMAKLDKDGSGTITGDEMAGLKMVVTNADGSQVVKDASELFNDDTDSINLGSYKELNHELSNGNALLGTFDFSIDGQVSNKGYNTLDKIDWLDANYDFSDKDKGIGRFAQDETGNVQALDMTEDLANFEAKVDELEGKLAQAWANIGINRDDVKNQIGLMAKQEAALKGQLIDEDFKAIQRKQEAEEEEKQVEAEVKAEEAAINEEVEKNKQKEKENIRQV